MSQTPKVHFLSLGCPKNRVDSELMVGQVRSHQGQVVADPSQADVIVVNTCGFIESAKEESIDAILQMAQHKSQGRCQTLVVTGCLSQRYGPELAKEIPEIDHLLGTGNFDELAGLIMPAAKSQAKPRLPIVQDGVRRSGAEHPRLRGPNRLVPFRHGEEVEPGKVVVIPDPDLLLHADLPRVASEGRHSRYLKISEGCNNTCGFCIIPKLRGPQRSRPIGDVVREAKRLVEEEGAVELVLVAQDLCAYGTDLQPRQHLAQLLTALHEMAEQAPGPVWIRCMYAYPKGLHRSVMEIMAQSPHIVPYLDMPLQHISDSLLRRMRRGAGGESTRRLLEQLRETIPGLTLRTTFITGLPGESEVDFRELYEFLATFRFEHVGIFAYSQEEDTAAGAMPDQVPMALAQARRAELLELQHTIASEHQAAMVGQVIPVLIDGMSEETELLLVGRHPGQAPDVDGVTYVTSGSAHPGDVVMIEVEEASAYDIAGQQVGHGAIDDHTQGIASAPSVPVVH